MPRVAPLALVGGPDPEGSDIVSPRIAAARSIALARSGGLLNRRLAGRSLRSACALSRASEHLVVQLAELERASGRGTERLLRVARTIADLAGEIVVSEAHLDEAAWFRPADLRLAAAEAS
jgi:magnesium chelatase family protein